MAKKQTTQQAPDTTNVLEAIFGKDGAAQIQASLAGGATYGDPEDLPVFWGKTDSEGRTRRDNPVVKSSQAQQAIFKWAEPDLSAFQRRMFDAGLYGSLDETDIAWGAADIYTQQAWKQLVTTAAGYYGAGKKVTPQQVLDMMVAGGAIRTAGTKPAEHTNPADFSALADATGTSVLGRRLSEDERNRVVGKLSASESPYLSPDSTTARPGQAAIATTARDQVRAIDPVRADSRSAVKVASVLSQMLGGRLPSETQTLPGEGG